MAILDLEHQTIPAKVCECVCECVCDAEDVLPSSSYSSSVILVKGSAQNPSGPAFCSALS